MQYWLMLIVFPVISPFIVRLFYPLKLKWEYVAINVGLIVFLSSLIYGLGAWSQTDDIEILNGYITGKDHVRVSCSHSYSCHCRTVKVGKDTTTQCDTCYEHSYDVDWRVFTSIGNTFEIDRVDRQGTSEPPRWTIVQRGQPYAKTHHYTNYIQASPNTLFNKMEFSKNKYLANVPAYPDGVFDYQYVNRVITTGPVIPDMQKWNTAVAESLRNRGAAKQVNEVIIFTQYPREFADAVKFNWLGGKKNDVVVVIGVKDYPNVEWVEVVSWATKNIFQAQLRDDLEGSTLDPIQTVNLIGKNIDQNFSRLHMKDYEYLSHDITPPTWVIVISIVVAVFGSLGLSLYFVKFN